MILDKWQRVQRDDPEAPYFESEPVGLDALGHQCSSSNDTTKHDRKDKAGSMKSPKERTYQRPCNDRDDDRPPRSPVPEHQWRRHPTSRSIALLIVHVLHMHCREDHQAHDHQPMSRGSIELELSWTTGYLCGTGAVAHEAERVDKVTEVYALICRAQVVVEPRQDYQDHCLVGTAKVLRGKAHSRNGCQQEAACLQRCESF